MTIWIDNGKSPDEPYDAKLDAKLEFGLPPNSPYGNFSVELMELCERIDEANRRLAESCAFGE